MHRNIRCTANGMSGVHLASKIGDIVTLHMLIRAGAGLEVPYLMWEGSTALFLAAQKGNMQACVIVWSYVRDTHIVGVQAVWQLLNRGAKYTQSLLLACTLGDVETVQVIVDVVDLYIHTRNPGLRHNSLAEELFLYQDDNALFKSFKAAEIVCSTGLEINTQLGSMQWDANAALPPDPRDPATWVTAELRDQPTAECEQQAAATATVGSVRVEGTPVQVAAHKGMLSAYGHRFNSHSR
jgi:hypothetical protein